MKMIIAGFPSMVLFLMVFVAISGPQNDLTRGIIVPNNAYNYRYQQKEEVTEVNYKVKVKYPARTLIGTYSDRLERGGWKPLPEDFLNPGVASSYVRGWTEHVDATLNPPMNVRQWLSQWEDSNHNIVSYLLRYESSPASNIKAPSELSVSVSYFPKGAVEAMRSSFRRATPPTDDVGVPYQEKLLEPEKLDFALRAAAENGDAGWLTRLLQQGANPNATDALKFSALMAAAMNGHNEIVRILIEKGADVNAKGDKGITALMVAAQHGRTSIVEQLIKKGADINARCCGKTALKLAEENGHSGTVEVLKQAGAKE
jgi:hypothetical protein